MTLYTIAITLILVMDPLGNIPVFLAILKQYDARTQVRIILRESIIAFFYFSFICFLRPLHITRITHHNAGLKHCRGRDSFYYRHPNDFPARPKAC